MSRETSESHAKPVTFEAGARAMENVLRTRGPEAYFANAADPLRAAFVAKARVHSGPGGMPQAGAQARATLDGLADRPRTGKTLAYVHVPFCETRCLYCMFYQNPYRADAAHAYAETLVKEIELWGRKAVTTGHPVHAVYFGGGTPTALAASDLKRVLDTLRRVLPLANDCEITIEGRIHNFDAEKIEAALAGGANRFSLGVQTFNTEVRQSMMRIDDRDACLRRLEELSSYDNAAVVMDLIYGFPGQTPEVWEEDLKIAASLPLDGIDCYQLNVFEKSPLARYVANGKLPPAADTAQKAEMFARSVEYFTRANWRRLSNNHWGRGTRERNIYNTLGKGPCDCLAFGCGAGGRLSGHGFMLERSLQAYTALVEAGEKPAAFLTVPSDDWALMRTISSDMESGAIRLAEIGRRFGVDAEGAAAPVVEQWIEAGLLVREGEWLRQTVAGQFWHVTLAQLLMDFLRSQLYPEREAMMRRETMLAGNPGRPAHPGPPGHAGHPGQAVHAGHPASAGHAAHGAHGAHGTCPMHSGGNLRG